MNFLAQLLASTQPFGGPWSVPDSAYTAAGNLGSAYLNQMGQRGSAMSGRAASDLRSWTDLTGALGAARLGAMGNVGAATQGARANVYGSGAGVLAQAMGDRARGQRLSFLGSLLSSLAGKFGSPQFGRGFSVGGPNSGIGVS